MNLQGERDMFLRLAPTWKYIDRRGSWLVGAREEKLERETEKDEIGTEKENARMI